MGFFKKIGKAIKKNVSFKNLVKIGTPLLGAVPFAGGALQSIAENGQAAHQAKKDAQALKAQGDYQAAQDAEMRAQALQVQIGTVAGSALGAVVQSGGQMFAKGVTEGAYNGLSDGVKQGLGTAGAGVVDSTITAWFKLHWKHILIALTVVGAIWLIRKNMSGNNNKRVSRRAR
ncbi:hypothetical protein ASE21_12435 [Flavobacterium sp. Root901]|uniref:hypothetical protein n=1 Tax=Flavobacterium sp. Root901 TaxID=1736605 RepID=UPI00070AE42C|nr:hypothetical protein [Flavobacterium sp. Root901]KRD10499.1 hypothetical protein ASE21_12435 [Flavobacterium sp. Root901]